MLGIKEKWIRIVFPLFLGIFVNLTAGLYVEDLHLLRSYFFHVLDAFIIYEIVRWVGIKVYKNSHSVNFSKKNILKHVLLSFIIVIPVILIFYSIFKYTFTAIRPRFSDVNFTRYVFVTLWTTITYFVCLFLQLSIIFIKSWRFTLIQKEKLEKENINARFTALKNEINPHFLFNNLNTLYGLINENQEIASRFLLNLSEIYRYILKANQKEIVSVDEELSIINSYSMLLKSRYGDNIDISIEKESFKNSFIPTLSIQMLLENCIKHNIIDEKNKLNVNIYGENEYLVIENNINLLKNNSNGLGLKNIINRYELLTDNQVIIMNDKNKFTVKIPLLKPIDYEYINN